MVSGVKVFERQTVTPLEAEYRKSEAIQSQSRYPGSHGSGDGDERVGCRACTRGRHSQLKKSMQRHSLPALKHLSFNWNAPDNYVELLSFKMEVMNILQNKTYKLRKRKSL